MRIKKSKREKITYSLICVFVRFVHFVLFGAFCAFGAFWCFLVHFVRVKSFRKKIIKSLKLP